jgi:tripartite-type tricarboxylate transporter receptor subunit TctC
MNRRTIVLALAIGVFSAPGIGPADAQNFPARPITLVVPYPAGGGVDAMARLVGQKLSVALGQQVVVDNRGGGNGNVGTRAVAKAEPDGYTLLLGYTGTLAINPTLSGNAGYAPRTDFAPIGMIASMPVALLAHPSFPGRSVADVIALAKKDPAKVALATGAVGTVSYLCAALFKSRAGLDVTVIPYRGTAPFLNDIIAGHVQVGFGVIGSALGNIQGGTLRALAVTSAQRSNVLPDIPTVAESGLPEFEAVLSYGLLAPAGTPRPIVDRINAELRKALASSDIAERVASEGGNVTPSSPEDYAFVIAREDAVWSKLIRDINLKID